MNVPMFNFDVSYTEKAVFQRQNMLCHNWQNRIFCHSEFANLTVD